MKDRYDKIVLDGLTITAKLGEEFFVKASSDGSLIINTVDKNPYYLVGDFDKITFEKIALIRNRVSLIVSSYVEEEEFWLVVKEAVNFVDYEYEIAYIDYLLIKEDGTRYFRRTCNDWYNKCRSYNSQRGSRLANLYEFAIWYAFKIITIPGFKDISSFNKIVTHISDGGFFSCSVSFQGNWIRFVNESVDNSCFSSGVIVRI